MNIYILEEYFNNLFIGSYNSNNVFIFFFNIVGGYMLGKVDIVGFGRDGKVNFFIYVLLKGYVVVVFGVRGRILIDDKGNYIGKVFVVIVDLKVVVRYLYFNDEVMLGDVNKIILNGISVGGVLFVFLGVSGNL